MRIRKMIDDQITKASANMEVCVLINFSYCQGEYTEVKLLTNEVTLRCSIIVVIGD
jgi:hypothetical protein